MNYIPEITDPMGAYWDQPKTSEIVVDDKTAKMTKETFDSLMTYNSSIPSGVYVGKMWKRTFKEISTLCVYSKIVGDNMEIDNRKIIIVEELPKKEIKNLELFGGKKDFPEKTMTVKQVSEILNVSKDLVKKRIRELWNDRAGVLLKNSQGGYLLTEEQVTMIKLRIEENSHILKVGDDRNALAKTDLEKKLLIKQGYDLLMEEVINLQDENKQLKIEKYENAPKVELAETALRDKTKQYSITDAGKHLGLHMREIFNILESKNMLTSKKLPSQKSLNCKLLEIKTNVVDGKNRPQAVMTMENMDNFRKRYMP